MSCLSYKIYKEQVNQGSTGLAKECQQICVKLEIEDVNVTTLTKVNFRKVAMKALHKTNEIRLRSSAYGEKCNRIMKDF